MTLLFDTQLNRSEFIIMTIKKNWQVKQVHVRPMAVTITDTIPAKIEFELNDIWGRALPGPIHLSLRTDP